MTEKTRMITYKYKVYGNAADFEFLDNMSRKVNFVWNYCCATADHCWNNLRSRWPYIEGVKYKGKQQESYKLIYGNPACRDYTPDKEQFILIKNGRIGSYDLQKLMTGSSDLLDLPSNTLNAICDEFDKSVKTKAKQIATKAITAGKSYFIGYRGKKSRPWIPFKGASIKFDHNLGRIRVNSRWFKLNIDRSIDGEICDCKFIKEPDGWFVAISIKNYKRVPITSIGKLKTIGVDLGLKNMITLSNGMKMDMPPELQYKAWGRRGTDEEIINFLKSRRDVFEKKSARYRIADKKIKQIEKSMSRWRAWAHYNLANQILDLTETVVIGDLSGKFIQAVAGKKSKSSSLGLFKTKLQWIGQKRQQVVAIVSEKNTTNTCSSCGEKTGPKGLEGLSIREWACSSCGSFHDRDVNAAKNIDAVYSKPIALSKVEEAS